MVAHLTGRREAAREHADAAIAYYRNREWPARQNRFISIQVARAETYAGRNEAALQVLQKPIELKAIFDGYEFSTVGFEAGRMCVSLGKRDEALAWLREMMAGACSSSPNEIRLDPFWSRLKDDPRFEQILRSAKPL